MKIYRPTPKDSETVIVFDHNMKRVSFSQLGLKAISILAVLFLTAAGLCWGVSTEAVSKKLESIDLWADNPANQLLISCFFLGVFCIGTMTVALWTLYVRKK